MGLLLPLSGWKRILKEGELTGRIRPAHFDIMNKHIWGGRPMKLNRIVIAFVTIVAAGGVLFSALAATPYKNVALNPNDVRAAGKGYPHATSNSEYPCNWPSTCAPDTTFLAKNAIDGKTLNTCHGSLACASWGPQMIAGLWWLVDFGHKVQVDKVIIWIRHDFPHDSWWKTATLVFSDSSKMPITIDSTVKPDTFKFASKVTNSLMINNLVYNENKWCAFTEIEVWGYDPPTTVRVSPSTIAPGKNPALCYMPGFSSKTIALPGHARAIELYNVQGKKVWTAAVHGANGTVTIPGDFARGVYRINFTD
jgi:hypothetical protein